MSYPLTTTLNRIWACNPCDTGKQRALNAAGKDAPDDEPITFQQIAEAVDFEDAWWCCRAEPQYSKEWRLFGVWCARQVQHLMSDQRSIDALDVAERYARGQATDEELAAAGAAAMDAISAAGAAAMDAISAAWVAWATNAAWAAWVAWATSATSAARAARAAAMDATEAAWAAQRAAFIQLVTTGTLPELVRREVAE